MNAACYYEFYRVLENYATVLVYCAKTHMNARALNKNAYCQTPMWKWDAFTLDEYKEYVRLLNGMGLKFTMTEEKERFVFTVHIADNKLVATKVILNAIRYLCEDPYPTIVKEFLRLAKQKVVGVNNYTKFILAHQIFNMGHGGHTFLPSYSLATPLSNKEVKEKMWAATSNDTVYNVIPRGTKPFNEKVEDPTRPAPYNYKYVDGRDKLFKLFEQQAPLKDLIKEYKILCAKYM